MNDENHLIPFEPFLKMNCLPCGSLLILAVLCAVIPPNLSAQEPGNAKDFVCPTSESATPLAMGRRLVGTLGCERCHLLGQEELTEFSRALLDDPWVINNEYATWRNSDRHAQAYATLLGDRSKRMASLLGVADVARDARCLACHATVPVEWMTDDELKADPAAVNQLMDGPGAALVTNGISCEACHGAAGDGIGPDNSPKGWNGPHKQEGLITEVFKQSWRFKSIADKQSENGFYDVRSPASRTRMCVSCHVGDPQRGRLVTHEMYAAGHPPLPAFEVETFMRDMPPHWRVLGTDDEPVDPRPDALAKKPKSVTQEFLENTNDLFFANLRNDKRATFDAMKEDFSSSFDRTRSLAVGAVVTWAQSARVTAALASDDSYPLAPHEQRWPELAAFECAACHHDLALDGWRAGRTPPTAPGRPMLRDWSSPLFVAVCQAWSKDGEVPPQVAAIEEFRNQATGEQPFGEPAKIHDKLEDAAKWADRLAENLEARPFDAAKAENILRSIAAVGADYQLDYESARHLVWGFDEVLREVDPGRKWDEVEQKLADAKAMFISDLATADVREANTVGDRQVKVLEIRLPVVLEKAAEYDARALQILFGELQRALQTQIAKP